MSQQRTIASSPPDASSPPRGEKARHVTGCLYPDSCVVLLPVRGSHRRMILSRPPAAKVSPSAEKTTEYIPPSCPNNCRASRPVGTSQTWISESAPPEANNRPSGEYAMGTAQVSRDFLNRRPTLAR